MTGLCVVVATVGGALAVAVISFVSGEECIGRGVDSFLVVVAMNFAVDISGGVLVWAVVGIDADVADVTVGSVVSGT